MSDEADEIMTRLGDGLLAQYVRNPEPEEMSAEDQMREECGPVWVAYIDALRSKPSMKEFWLTAVQYGQEAP